MRAVIQRVNFSSVEVDGKVVGKIEKGLNVLLGITQEDSEEDIKYLRDKIVNLRIFEDEFDKMNKSLKDIKGELLVISQFTLYGDCRKGRRPNFMSALNGEAAEKLYSEFVRQCKEEVEKVETGVFGANMKVSIENDGPVTIIVDSKKVF